METGEASDATLASSPDDTSLNNLSAISENAINLEIALRELQNEINANGYVVSRLNLLYVTLKSGPNLICGNIDNNMIRALSKLDSAAALHMKNSFLPFMWSGMSSKVFASGSFTSMLNGSISELSGIGFPVVNGRIATGYCLFFGRELRVSNAGLFEIHQRTCKIVGDLLLLNLKHSMPHWDLSSLERSYLQLVANGFKSQEIADAKGVSVNTVNTYLIKISEKLKTRSRMHSVSRAIRLGLIV